MNEHDGAFMFDDTTSLLDAALTYAARGWHVFPLHNPTANGGGGCSCGDPACGSVGKHPRTEHGFQDATTDAAIIRAWWKRWPRANIGIATGAVSGIDVLDVDERSALAALQRQLETLIPDTLTSATGGGGWHYLFAYPVGDVPIPSTTKLRGIPGLDVRANAGYIVAPPSMHESGCRYQWLNDPMAPAVMPADLVDFLKWATPATLTPRTHAAAWPVLSAEEAEAACAHWLRRALDRAEEGNRNPTGFWLACQLRDEGVDEDAASDCLAQYALSVPSGTKPYTNREAQNSLRQAYKVAPRERARSRSTDDRTYPDGDDRGADDQESSSPEDERAEHGDADGEQSAGTSGAGGGGGGGKKKQREHEGSEHDESSSQQGRQQKQQNPTWQPHTMTADTLMKAELPAVRWVVDGLLAEGLTLLAAKPKKGKSTLMLSIACSVSQGTLALGHFEIEPSEVLYLALEDNERRMQRRLRRMLCGEPAPRSLHLTYEWLPLDVGGLAALAAWLDQHPAVKVVVIDTLELIRPKRKLANGLYGDDYASVRALQHLAGERQLAMVAITHLRKAPSDDPFDEINASNGLLGGVDNAIVLRPAQGVIEVHRRGREYEDDTPLALKGDKETLLWSWQGTAEDAHRSESRKKILECLHEHGPLTPLEMSEFTDLKREQVRKLLSRLLQEKHPPIEKDDATGKYSIAPSQPSQGSQST